ncbi:HlyD family efflux transporter periplasmic adaptor subunit [Oceanisphaera psychrotolerans]|uniref:Peptidase M50 n=1 Tax=Oceanisphaera psychrotolerans TaxID=1414654 RepID=A0A1J4QD93_9GAMM|nr:HlyD family efflux transporter periplasmic adaptor subunit [Oceanisphaera psychrotolerans]OIN07056.1 peptidase M50 [Oceanisphaera psychrotolerans]
MTTGAVLPPLRQNLRLLPGAHDEDGAPRWLLFDAVRNQYFALSAEAIYLIRHWQAGASAEGFLQELKTQGHDYRPEELAAFIDFVVSNNLNEARSAEASARIYQQHAARLLGFWRWLIHHYLFIRIPLCRPDPWLNRWTPRLNWLFAPVTHYLLLSLGALGLVLVVRQWDSFWSTFLHFFSLEGLAFYGLTLLVVKSAHELGHAFAAKRQGCRVASMGVALLVMFPVLYTDTTDAWRLRSRAARLRIVTAGVRTELYLALLATFLWNLLPDGPLRSAAFFVATTSWVTSVLVNISPFLRFDGYYAFSDWLGIENLQQRAFAFGRWRLRHLLLGLKDPLPEPQPRGRTRLMVAYAWATWLYRFFLFLGIALLVYHLFFKVLGILLFVVEVLWFIALPIWREVSVWWKRRSECTMGAGRLLFWGLATVMLMLSLLPLHVGVSVPAVLKARSEQSLFVSEPAVITEVMAKQGDAVEAGQLLVRLESEPLNFELQQVEEELRLAGLLLDRSGSSVQEKAVRAITEQQYQRLLERKSGLQARQERLQLRAPFTGRITQIEPLHPGVWVSTEMSLLSVVEPTRFHVEGYIGEQYLDLVGAGSKGVFIADRPGMAALPVTVRDVDIGAVFALPYGELSSEYGGPIAVRRVVEDRLVPEEGHYRVSMTLDDIKPVGGADARLPGVVRLEGEPRSWLWYQLRRMLAILIRESGF